MVSNRFYVYVHAEGDEVVYVGKGCGSRLLETRGRKEDHKQFMLSKYNEGDYSFATMLEYKLFEQDALNLESRLISYCRPKFNRTIKCRGDEPTKGLVISRLLKDLEWFEEKEKQEAKKAKKAENARKEF